MPTEESGTTACDQDYLDLKTTRLAATYGFPPLCEQSFQPGDEEIRYWFHGIDSGGWILQKRAGTWRAYSLATPTAKMAYNFRAVNGSQVNSNCSLDEFAEYIQKVGDVAMPDWLRFAEINGLTRLTVDGTSATLEFADSNHFNHYHLQFQNPEFLTPEHQAPAQALHRIKDAFDENFASFRNPQHDLKEGEIILVSLGERLLALRPTHLPTDEIPRFELDTAFSFGDDSIYQDPDLVTHEFDQGWENKIQITLDEQPTRIDFVVENQIYMISMPSERWPGTRFLFPYNTDFFSNEFNPEYRVAVTSLKEIPEKPFQLEQFEFKRWYWDAPPDCSFLDR